jgi:hypothetical protein
MRIVGFEKPRDDRARGHGVLSVSLRLAFDSWQGRVEGCMVRTDREGNAFAVPFDAAAA